MPAQIYVTKEQIAAAHELDEDVIITEPPSPASAQALDFWVMEEAHAWGSTHRSVVVDQEGTILGDEVVDD